ncbi:LuxR C-terminal-related transcriptional regulator [Kitasatospora sp. NPDC097643]|uniref:helix-turn-helix transcriptional regulator n=1 Tax=Kitasatospora sp. NPDC097643 TaxID=3157230 RepID=UPI0033299859
MYEGLGLGREAGAVYGLMLGEGVSEHTELARALGLTPEQVRAALERLAAAGLVRPTVDPEALQADGPATLDGLAAPDGPVDSAGPVGRRPLRLADPREGLRALLARQEARLLAQQQEFDRTRTTVTRLLTEYAVAEPGIRQRDTERLIGQDSVVSRLEQLAAGCRFETMSFQTQVNGNAATAAGLALNLDGLARGVRLRTIYPEAARRHGPSLSYAAALGAHGAQIRTAPALPVHRMIVFDHDVALLPAGLDPTCLDAVLVSAPAVVAALRALFEAVWATAVPIAAQLPAGAAADDPARPRADDLTRQERGLLDLLSQGFTDEAVANRLALSVRTVRRTTAALMARLGARSRFEAGLRAKERGWL